MRKQITSRSRGQAEPYASRRTCTLCLAPFVNSSLPSHRANRVSSLPRPTFSPGWMCVPRWRTMTLPSSQPGRRTSSRRDAVRGNRGRYGWNRDLSCVPWYSLLMLTRRLRTRACRRLAGAGFFSASSFFAAFLAAASQLGRADGLDLDARELLAMAAQLLVVLALLELEHELLLALELFEHDGRDLRGSGLAGSASTFSPSTTQMASSSTFAPTSASSFSMFSLSPGATLYCLPPVFTIAYMSVSLYEIKRKAIAYQRDRSKSM